MYSRCDDRLVASLCPYLYHKPKMVHIWTCCCMKPGSLQARVCTLFAQTQGLHFQGLLPHSFLFKWTLFWYKHGIMAIGSIEFPQISIVRPIRRCNTPGSLQAPTGLDAYITFLIVILPWPVDQIHCYKEECEYLLIYHYTQKTRGIILLREAPLSVCMVSEHDN